MSRQIRAPLTMSYTTNKKNSESNLQEARFIMQSEQNTMIIEKKWKWNINACRPS